MSHIDLPEPPDEYAPTGETIKAYGLACYEHGGASYKAGNTALLETLMALVYRISNGGTASEIANAVDGAKKVLREAGMLSADGTLDWDALDARKPKRQSWEEAVRECVTDPAEVERLLSLDKGAE